MVKSRKYKLKKRILDALILQQELSEDRGVFVNEKYPKLTTKQRRHSGWITPKILQKGKFSEMIANAEEPTSFYDDWMNDRDGRRHNSDSNHFFKKVKYCCFSEEEIRDINKKISKKIAIRNSKKMKNSRDRI